MVASVVTDGRPQIGGLLLVASLAKIRCEAGPGIGRDARNPCTLLPGTLDTVLECTALCGKNDKIIIC